MWPFKKKSTLFFCHLKGDKTEHYRQSLYKGKKKSALDFHIWLVKQVEDVKKNSGDVVITNVFFIYT